MAVNPSIQLGTDGNWAIKEDNLLAYKKLGSKFFNREFDFSRGTTATFVGEDGLIQESAIDVPRIDFADDTTGHLLLEPQSTNLVTYSEDFSGWLKYRLVASSTTITNPEGLSGAYLLSQNIGDTNAGVVAVSGTISSINRTFTVYVKKGSTDWMRLSTNSVPKNTWFNINDGTVGVTNVDHIATISDVSNGWFRVSVTELNSNQDLGRIYLSDSDGSSVVLNDGSTTLNIWGAQLEQLPYATSYIPTSGSTVTRNQELCNNSGTVNDFNSEEGVIYAEIAALASSDTNNPIRGISISSGSTNNTIFIYYQAVLNRLSCIVISNGTTQFSNSTELFNVADYLKIALKYKQNDFALWVNGVEVVTDTVGNAPIGLSELAFDNGVGNDKFYGKTKNIQVFKRALTDAELYLLTVTQYESYQEMATALNYTL